MKFSRGPNLQTALAYVGACLLQVTLELTHGTLSPVLHLRHPNLLALGALGVDARPWFLPREFAASPAVGAAGATRVGSVSR